ncbi:MAG TPA: SdpI family protein [Terriglobia bacterium]|nr:SdpI family protein [Terriglobia bacterium]
MKRNYFVIGALLVAAAVVASGLFYPHLASTVPTHWNVHGQVDRYGSRWAVLIILPATMTGVMLLMAALPWLSPKKYEVNAGRHGYLQIMLVLLAFFLYFHIALLSASAGRRFDLGKVLLGGVCALIAGLGPLIARLPRNFYVGVRTPWTLADERVWASTHRFGAKCLTAAGVLGVVVTLAGAPIWVGVVILCAGALAPVVHSLVYYKQLEHRGAV